MKKVAISLLILAAARITVSLTLGILLFTETMPEFKYGTELKDKVEVGAISGLGIPSVLKYGGVNYIIDENNIFSLYDYDKYEYGYPDEVISWNETAYDYEYYYSDTKENPLFIYKEYEDILYISSAYKYTEDTFTVDGTEIGIKFSDIIGGEKISGDTYIYNSNTQRIKLYPSSSNTLYIWLTILNYNGKFYAQVGDSEYSELSLNFVNALIDEGVVYFQILPPPGNTI